MRPDLRLSRKRGTDYGRSTADSACPGVPTRPRPRSPGVVESEQLEGLGEHVVGRAVSGDGHPRLVVVQRLERGQLAREQRGRHVVTAPALEPIADRLRGRHDVAEAHTGAALTHTVAVAAPEGRAGEDGALPSRRAFV